MKNSKNRVVASGPIEVTSRFGNLAPVVQTLTPDDAPK
jgi:hypothetical protein